MPFKRRRKIRQIGDGDRSLAHHLCTRVDLQNNKSSNSAIETENLRKQSHFRNLPLENECFQQVVSKLLQY